MGSVTILDERFQEANVALSGECGFTKGVYCLELMPIFIKLPFHHPKMSFNLMANRRNRQEGSKD